MSNETNKLKELKGSGYEIADGEPNILGWDVRNSLGQSIGEVKDLLFDEKPRKVRYIIVSVDDDKNGSDSHRKVLVPIGLAALHEKDDDVLLPGLGNESLAALPDYKTGSFDAATEQNLLQAFAGLGTTGFSAGAVNDSADNKDIYSYDHFNEDNLYRNRNSGNDRTIPIIEENINIGKRIVETGGVRVSTNIVEQPVKETVELKEERVTVQRNTVDKPLMEGSFEAFEEGTIELTERAEVPVISKEARVVEEIFIDKEVDHRNETIQDSVRKTEVEIEELNSTQHSNRS